VVISDRANDFAFELLRGSASGIAFLVDEQLSGIGAVRGALRGLQVGQSVLDPGILDALIHRGGDEGIADLTSREVEVLEQMAQGLSNRAIAEKLHISVKSIEKGVTAIFLKLGPFDQGISDRRVSAALVYLRHRVDPFGPDDQADRGRPRWSCSRTTTFWPTCSADRRRRRAAGPPHRRASALTARTAAARRHSRRRAAAAAATSMLWGSGGARRRCGGPRRRGPSGRAWHWTT